MLSKIFQWVMFMVCTLSISGQNNALGRCIQNHLNPRTLFEFFQPCIMQDRHRDPRPCACVNPQTRQPENRDLWGGCPPRAIFGCATPRIVEVLINNDWMALLNIMMDNRDCLAALINSVNPGGSFSRCGEYKLASAIG